MILMMIHTYQDILIGHNSFNWFNNNFNHVFSTIIWLCVQNVSSESKDIHSQILTIFIEYRLAIIFVPGIYDSANN